MSLAASTSTARPAGDGRTARARWLRVDALVSGAAGVVLAAGSTALDGPFGVSTAFLVGVGLFFVAYAASLAVVARLAPGQALTRTIALGNLTWVALSIGVIAADVLTLTAAGTAVAALQAAAVALLAELQLLAARRP
ncbi:MAG: hypothetical protein R3C15_13195 [Thermoleophilia bacterium]